MRMYEYAKNTKKDSSQNSSSDSGWNPTIYVTTIPESLCDVHVCKESKGGFQPKSQQGIWWEWDRRRCHESRITMSCACMQRTQGRIPTNIPAGILAGIRRSTLP